ncbi:MAG: T9SS type A sorting domain-containing protein [Crocinitomicaceae bacterium]
MKNLILTIALCLTTITSYALTCLSIGNGDWDDPLTWSCGSVPAPGDTIIISVGDTVTLNSTEILLGAPMLIVVNGYFLFDTPAAKLHLECGSEVVVTPTGEIASSGVGQPSHNIKICGQEVWQGFDGPLIGPVILTGPLPIELVNFEIEQGNSVVIAQWETASEYNNDYFTLQGSLDGANWSDLLNVNGAGTTSEAQYYQEEYDNRESKFPYYRLKQTDFNGSSSFSKVLTVKMIHSPSLTAFPNPVNGSFVTVIWEDANGVFDVLVTDLSGRNVALERSVSNGQVVFDTDEWLSGYYLIQIRGNGISEQVKLVKP